MNFTWKSASKTELQLYKSIALLLNDNESLLRFLFDPQEPKLRKRAGILKEDSWDLEEEEQLLIRAALDLWSGSGHLALWECLERWDRSSWIQFILCMTELKEIGPALLTALHDRSTSN